MKKLFSILALLAALSIMFISCKKDDTDKGQGGYNPDQDGGHVHAFLDWSFVTEPTCTAGGLCESYCECGDHQTKTLPAKGHNFVGLICDSCGEINAEVTSDEYFVFTELDDGSYSIAAKDVKNMPGVVVIPSTHKDKPVTKIADCAFLGMPTEDNPDVVYCTSIEHVIIPDSVTSIGDYAFMGCFMLKSVDIPDSVSNIGMYGFSGLIFLDSITLPNQLTAIEEGTFEVCTSLKSINIPNSVTSIGEYAFEMCPLITSITIPESVKNIGDHAFYGSKVVEIINHSSINFNDELLDKITNSHPEVHSGESKLVIQGDYQFYPIDGEMTLINYVGDDDNLILPNDCNGEKYKLQCISFAVCGSDEMTAIIEQKVGDKLDRAPVFPYIRSVMLPDFVTEIESSWFENCFTLESVKIRETSKLQRIAEDAFERCPSFTYNEDEYAYYVGNDENPYVCLLKCKDSQISTFEFKPGTTIIGAKAFASCSHLTNVTLPDSLAIIGDLAFRGCEAFTDFVMPDSVTHIGSEVFVGCLNIERMILSNNIYFIGNSVFSYLRNLQYNERDNCMYLGSETNPYLVLISANKYESTHFEMKDDTRLIYDGAFYQNRIIESVVIGESVIGIGRGVFDFQSTLKTVYIPASVEYIRESVIWDVEDISVDEENMNYKSVNGNLYSKDGKVLIRYASKKTETSFAIPDGVVEIGEGAFILSDNLKSIHIPDTVNTVGSGAFASCGIESITLPSGVTSINDGTFNNCDSLTSIIIPDSITSIGHSAFSNCRELKYVEIGDGVTSIGDYAFEYCTDLVSIVIGKNVANIGYFAFGNCEKLVEVINKSSLNIVVGSRDLGYIAYEALEVHSGESKIVNVDDYLFYTFDGNNYLLAYIGNETDFVLPDSYNNECYEIYDYAFCYCEALTSIVIPKSVTAIGYEAFQTYSNWPKLSDIYYTGTEDEWNMIVIEQSNSEIDEATIHFNYTPEE